MRRLFLVCCAIALVLPPMERPVQAQRTASSRAETLRQELTSSRRVGHLRREESSRKFTLTDDWDKKTYEVMAGPGVDLKSHVDRYVALRGELLEAAESGTQRFKALRITPLDQRRTGKNSGLGVRPAAAEVTLNQPGNEPRASAPSIGPADTRPPSSSLPSPILTRPDSSAPLTQLTPLSTAPTRPPDEVEPIPTLPPLSVTTDPMAMEDPTTIDGWLGLQAGGMAAAMDRWWARGEVLLWSMDATDLPALVTSSPTGTPLADAGVLGLPTTSVLFGGGVNDDPQTGFRVQFGGWIDQDQIRGIEAEYLWFDDQETRFADKSLGDRILARPFFNAAAGIDTAALISYPGLLRGDIAIDAATGFYSLGIRARLSRSGPINANQPAPGYRIDFLVGYRYAKLKDSVIVYENLVSLDPLNPGLFEIEDSFKSTNEFNGIDLGFVQQSSRGPFFFEWITKVAVGFNRQSVSIAGSSVIDEAGMVEAFPGGILALPTNIGNYARDEFAVIPELAATVGWNVNPRLTFTLGYSLVYFSNVARAGDHISLNLNANYFPPPAMPLTGPIQPSFAFRETDFWTQGISLGANYRW